MDRRTLKAIDLFSGCGGLSLGLQQAGFEVILAIDADELACNTYRLNHPTVRLVEGDIRKLSPGTLRKELGLRRGALHLLAGCPPCQGFSRIRTLNGNRQGDNGMNNLVWSFFKFAQEFLPKAILLENVPGLAVDKRFKRLKHRLEEELGYRIQHDVLNAADFGIPQNRRRFVMVAAKRFVPTLAVPANSTVTVRQVLASLPQPGKARDELHDYIEQRAEHVQRIIAAIPYDGGSRRDLPSDLVLSCHQGFDGFRDVYGRMYWDRPAPTITGGCINPSKGRFLHPTQPRAITLREAALLQGFPRDYKFDLRRGRYSTAQMIGNAFPPAFAARQAEGIAKGLQRWYPQRSENE